MSVWKISLKNILSKPLYSFLSVFTLSLSILLLLGIAKIKASFEHQMDNNLASIDMVVGAKGSPLQLVLASVLHLDNPTGNISYKEANKIAKNPLIGKAIPISYGDNYNGFRIVGTTNEFKDLYEADLKDGRDVEKTFEVIIGHSVAVTTNLNVGDTFLSSHGLVDANIETHDEKFTVVGVLKPTQKVIDRLIISNLESIWDVHNHEDEGSHEDTHDNQQEEHEAHEHDDHEKEHIYEADIHESHEHNAPEQDLIDESKEITSLLVSFRNPTGFFTLPRTINKDTNMQAALPKYELDKLYEFMGVGLKTISWIAYLILIISGLTIFISLYKMVKERAFDLALLRTYGASNFQLVKMVAYEGFTIVTVAYLFGLILVKTVLPYLLNFTKTNAKGVMLQQLPFADILHIGIIVLGIITISIAIAVYPVLKMKISNILSNEK
jgi:putative ABC transport system permease protein